MVSELGKKVFIFEEKMREKSAIVNGGGASETLYLGYQVS